jgi:hypothetical protein
MARTPQSFPELTPSSRSFSPGEYPQTVFEAQNGAKTIIRYGNKQVNAKLNLSFTNITDSEAFLILEHYKDVNKNWDYSTFSISGGLKGINSASGLNSIQLPEGGALRWRYSGPPQYSSVFPGKANVSCSFVACLDGD